MSYCEAHSSPPDPVLYELERETNLKTLAPQMASGPLQGQFLTLLSQLLRPETILEIGTFTGYAAICLAKGLAPGGKLHTIEVNEELEYISRKYFEKAGLSDKIIPHTGDAKQIIPTLPGTFDLVFIDAGKLDYAHFYDLVFDRVRPGGLLLADNVLWSGKVIQGETDKHTLQLDAFNKKIRDDDRVDNLLLPIRDGMMIVRKKNSAR